MLVFILDQWSKVFIVKNFALGSTVEHIEGFLEFTYIRNTGVAFGLLSSTNSPTKAVLLSGLALLVVVMIVVYILQLPSDKYLSQISLTIILAGALGNLYDRMAYGYVIDFIHFQFKGYSWPVFNVADTAISLGVLGLAVELIRDEIATRA